ncbi:MAG: right-handed parallel beta-helix repeat-containing protein [Planctomycetota bacterium]|nr:right-handed parallel beta-helix repeat-containing protein [Planctomycetota bacterium]
MSKQELPQTTIHVGPAGAKGVDAIGETGAAIQLAIDALAFQGGGTVRLRAGTYVLSDAVRLRAGVALCGEGERTVLRRGPLVWSPLACDADRGQTEIAPSDASRFRPGMGVCLHDEKSGWAFSSQPQIVARIDAGVLHLKGLLTEERYAADGGRVVNYFPLILGEHVEGASVEGLLLDGVVEGWDGPEGPRTALLQLIHCPGSRVRHVVARNGLGDGITFGMASVGTTVEDCETHDNRWYGIHPGSHSARSAVRRCHIHRNGSDGLYICWGIHHGCFEDNHIHGNGWRQLRSGISIGHKDTDNLLARNRIHDNRKFGICVRRKTEANGAHRNVFLENTIENNGTRGDEMAEAKSRLQPWEGIGAGIHVSGCTRDLRFERNTIRETRSGEARAQRHAFVFAEDVQRVVLRENVVEGHPEAAVVDRAGALAEPVPAGA